MPRAKPANAGTATHIRIYESCHSRLEAWQQFFDERSRLALQIKRHTMHDTLILLLDR